MMLMHFTWANKCLDIVEKRRNLIKDAEDAASNLSMATKEPEPEPEPQPQKANNHGLPTHTWNTHSVDVLNINTSIACRRQVSENWLWGGVAGNPLAACSLQDFMT